MPFLGKSRRTTVPGFSEILASANGITSDTTMMKSSNKVLVTGACFTEEHRYAREAKVTYTVRSGRKVSNIIPVAGQHYRT